MFALVYMGQIQYCRWQKATAFTCNIAAIVPAPPFGI
jgi:hypothetical protein